MGKATSMAAHRSSTSVGRPPELRGALTQGARVGVRRTKGDVCPIIVFSIGGRRLVARMKEISRVREWVPAMPMPCRSDCINALVRFGDEVLPVLDLAARLNLIVRGSMSFCLIVKSRKGSIAVRIDGDVPSLHRVDQDAIIPVVQDDSPFAGICRLGTEEIPVYSFATL